MTRLAVGLAVIVACMCNGFVSANDKPVSSDAAIDGPLVIVVVGAQGTTEYGREFAKWAERWKQASVAGGAEYLSIGHGSIQKENAKQTDRERLLDALGSAESGSDSELWLILIGHGTFDGRQAKFNLRGPDLTASELATHLAEITRPVALINCTSSSGPFVKQLAAANRTIVTATKSGFEQNFARFGDYLSRAIADPGSDLDKDEQTSLLEAFLTASRKTAEFYRTDGRIQSEHALLDDNGDGQAVRADAFRGIRPIRKSPGSAATNGIVTDGYRAHQFHLQRSGREQRMPPNIRKQRDELELAVIHLRDRKAGLVEDAYYQQLEELLLQLARLYEANDR